MEDVALDDQREADYDESDEIETDDAIVTTTCLDSLSVMSVERANMKARETNADAFWSGGDAKLESLRVPEKATKCLDFPSTVQEFEELGHIQFDALAAYYGTSLTRLLTVGTSSKGSL